MFTNTKCSIYAGQDKVYTESVCLSTDVKPTTGIANGSTCIEMNTGKKFMFNEDSGEWVEVPSSGGGGGGDSDFSTAVLTFVLSEGSSAQFVCANFEIQGDEGMALGENGVFAGARTTFDVILCKGNTMLTLTQYPSGSSISISGNIEDMGQDTYLITGDCTITIS